MKFNYIKLSETQYKFLLDNDGGYGEFYVNFHNEGAYGSGEIKCKDKAYGHYLISQLEHELTHMPKPEEMHDCKLDQYASGHCDNPVHAYDLLEQRAESESAEYRNAH